MARAMPLVVAAALLNLSVFATSAAATLQIRQVIDRSPELAVLLSGGTPGVLADTKAAAGPPRITAALGTTPLALKSVAPWPANQAFSLVVALDVSGSIGSTDFNILKSALAALMARLPAGSQVALLAIGEEVHTVKSFGTAAAAASALDTLVPDSPETALYEAVLAGQQMAARASADLPLRRMVLVVTDGIDDSRHGFGREETLRKLGEGDVPVFALALVAGRASEAQREAVKALAQIARASGGSFVQSAAAQAATNLERLMTESDRARLLVFDCAACVRDGVVRTLQLSDGVSSDLRGVRLLAPAQIDSARPPATAPAPAPPRDTAPAAADRDAHDWLKDVLGVLRITIAALKLWQWAVILAMTLAIAAVVRKLLQHRAQSIEDEKHRTEGGEGSETVTSSVRIVGARLKSGVTRTVTLDIAGQGRRQMHIGTADVVLGRSERSDVPMEGDAEASNRHAALYVLKDILMLRDLDSANGTHLNGTRILRPEPLHDRDLVRVGRTEVRVYMGAV